MKPAVSWIVSPVSVRSAVTCQHPSGVDQFAAVIRWLNRMCWSIPSMAAVSLMYCRMSAPSAIAFSPFHGRKEYPRVYMSESDRMPGYRNRSHVPPIASRASKIA